ncbi:MAG: (2Fe-2S)-binding protein, partial [Acidobacteria bacterium]|nr:(2Fe-2S)-binding protein [Acidobacteriota bacterium]
GTKYGCGIAQCGACTVHVGDRTMRSCVLPVSALGDRPVTTIEGLEGPTAAAVQKAWRELDVPQCGFCQSGQVMTAAVLLSKVPKPTDDDIDGALAGNVCRCATYVRIRAAVHAAAEELSHG